MSAITGIGDSTTIRPSARTSSSRGTAQRTRSPPASAIAWICFMVASKSAVSVFVIDWTATGAPPPIFTPPTSICRLEATAPKGYLRHRGAAGRAGCFRKLRVEGLYLGRVLLGDRLALELHRGRQLLATGLPLVLEQLEALDLLDAGQLLVGHGHTALDLGEQRLLAVLLDERRRHV